MNIFIIASILLLIFYLKGIFFNRLKIKGPKGLPILGNLLQLGKNPHEKLLELYVEYGPIYSLRFGSIPTVVLTEPDIIKKAFLEHGDTFNPRFVRNSRKTATNGLNMASSNGEYWKAVRGMVSMDLTVSKMKQFESKIQLEADLCCDYFKTKIGQVEKPHPFLGMFAMNNILNLTMSKRFPYDVNGFSNKFLLLIKEIFIYLGKPFPQDLIPILYPFVKNEPKRFFELFREIHGYIETIVEEKLKTMDFNDPKDMIESLIIAFQKASLPMTGVAATCFDLTIAGTDTTSNEVIYLILELCNRPIIQEKLFSELESAFPDSSDIQYSDRTKTPYLNACIKEAARRFPTAPLGVPHLTQQDIEFEGHFIPKDTQILANIFGTHLSPKLWDSPREFIPERFLGSMANENLKKLCLFGFGNRNCVGMNMADFEMYILSAKLLRNFKFSRPTDQLFDTGGIFGLTLTPMDYSCLIEKR